MEYNIPVSWIRDISVCGTYSHTYYRNQLWADYTDVQREHAARTYHDALRKLEELRKNLEKHAACLGEVADVWWYPLTSVIHIDLGEQYTPKQMLQLVEDAISEEDARFNRELAELLDDVYETVG